MGPLQRHNHRKHILLFFKKLLAIKVNHMMHSIRVRERQLVATRISRITNRSTT